MPALLNQIRAYGYRGALLRRKFRIPEERRSDYLHAECFRLLTTDQLLALFKPLLEEFPSLRLHSEGGWEMLQRAVRYGVDLRVMRLLWCPKVEVHHCS